MSIAGGQGNDTGDEVIPESLQADFDRMDDAVRRELNLVRHGTITPDEMWKLLAGEIRMIAAEHVVVRIETADMDAGLAQILGGAA